MLKALTALFVALAVVIKVYPLYKLKCIDDEIDETISEIGRLSDVGDAVSILRIESESKKLERLRTLRSTISDVIEGSDL